MICKTSISHSEQKMTFKNNINEKSYDLNHI